MGTKGLLTGYNTCLRAVISTKDDVTKLLKMTSNETDYSYDEIEGVSEKPDVQAMFQNLIRTQYIVAYLIVCTLGVTLNLYVIIAGCRVYHKLRFTPSMWFLALAVTHLVFSAFLVLQFLYAWYYFNWHYGQALCKVSSYIIYASMFSTAALLSLWSLSSCVGSCFQGLARRCSSRGMSLALVLSSWTYGAVLSSPSLLSRELRYTKMGQQCIDDYDLNKEKTTDYGMKNFKAVVLSRFLLGFVAPAFIMTISACLDRWRYWSVDGILKKVACAIRVAYFICWTPLLVMGLVQINEENHKSLTYGLPLATVLAAAHSFVYPVIYLLLGRQISMEWMVQENFDHEARSNFPQDHHQKTPEPDEPEPMDKPDTMGEPEAMN
ncbi:hypothetical protein NFI96_004683 [Prochilodus magdalenae]|nr:hypothetical protein NFI96_004683 [Prochilodus magdalenae]